MSHIFIAGCIGWYFLFQRASYRLPGVQGSLWTLGPCAMWEQSLSIGQKDWALVGLASVLFPGLQSLLYDIPAFTQQLTFSVATPALWNSLARENPFIPQCFTYIVHLRYKLLHDFTC